MNPGSVIQLVDALTELEDVVFMCSCAVMWGLGFLSSVKLISMLPS